ncbi:hypothetical protein [Pseudolysinimonas kribbensis]|nr:hypothetical protein [Pseudolysinimonas kribbensis]
MHIWDLWNQKDYPHYRDYRPRFVSEFGWQGPPTWSTLESWIPDHPLTPESPGMLVHQKAENGNVKLTDGLVPHLPLPNDMRDWHWAMSLNQAMAIRTAVEWFRSLQPHCMGTILWQLNDCWPVVSWAAIDGLGRRKPLWYALREAYRPRLLTIQPDGDGFTVAAVNDLAEDWSATLVVTRRAVNGTELATSSQEVTAQGWGAEHVAITPAIAAPGDARGELIVATLGDERALWFFAEPRDSALDPGAVDAVAERIDGGCRLRITARGLVRDLAILADIVDPEAVADRSLIDLLPGESVVVDIRTSWDGDPSRFAEADVVRSLNDLLGSATVAGAGRDRVRTVSTS